MKKYRSKKKNKLASPRKFSTNPEKSRRREANQAETKKILLDRENSPQISKKSRQKEKSRRYQKNNSGRTEKIRSIPTIYSSHRTASVFKLDSFQF